VSDEFQLMVTRKDNDSSSILSKARSNLIARGLRDAALIVLQEQLGGAQQLAGDVRLVAGSAHLEDVLCIIRNSAPFDHVFCGPEQCSIETATMFGDPIVLKGLDAWYRGAHEGKPAQLVQEAMRALILHPDIKPPGFSPISGLPGETYNEFLEPLMLVMRELKRAIKPDERFLAVTSGGDFQAINQMAAVGFWGKPDKKQLEEIASSPYLSQTGGLFRLTDKGLEEARVIPSDSIGGVVPLTICDNKEPGIYLLAAEYSG
jgi:hypothetical protein